MNQTPEQVARDQSDQQSVACGWVVQDMCRINLRATSSVLLLARADSGVSGVAVREYRVGIDPADYGLFVNSRPVVLIESKRAEEMYEPSVYEVESGDYAKAKLRLPDKYPLLFVYESTGIITLFIDHRYQKPMSRDLFGFHQPATLLKRREQAKSWRGGLLSLSILPNQGLWCCQIMILLGCSADMD